MKGYRRDFRRFSKAAQNLECGDDEQAIFEKIVAHGIFTEDVVVSQGQWIIADEDHIEFCLSGSNPSVLVDLAGNLANVWNCIVHGVWAGKITDLSYFIPWCSRNYYENDGLSITCATMGRAVFYGDEFGYYRAPVKSDKTRQSEYYSFVWGNVKGVEAMASFFEDEPCTGEGVARAKKKKSSDDAAASEEETPSSRDEITYPTDKIIDEYGNKIENTLEASVKGHIAFGNEKVCALPVRKMLVEGKSARDFLFGFLIKYDKFFEKVLLKHEVNSELDYLRSTYLATGDYKIESGGFLLDKKGNKITSLSDFDHAVDSDGEIFYRVFESDLDGDSLSSKAAEKWRKKLGLNESFLRDENFCYNEDKTEIIELINKSAKSLCVEEGIKKIRENAFKNCTSLEEITLPSTLKEIENNAFTNCSSLKSISIPDGVKFIGNDMGPGFSGTFSGCSSLESVTLSKNLERIDIFTFKNCTSLKKIVIPRSVKEVSDGAFSGCSSLKEIIVEEGNESYRSDGGLLYSADGTILYECLETVEGTVTLLETTKKISGSAFSFNQKITKVILPSGFTDLCLGEFFGDFSGMRSDLEIVFSNPNGWYGTDDYREHCDHRGGILIPPDQLQAALKKYSYMYNAGIYFVKPSLEK